MIVIIDYGMGNLKSVRNALNYLGIENKISDDYDEIRKADALILPGVGAFPDAMDTIEKLGLDKVIKEETEKGKYLLGICLGMQLLFEKGYEGLERTGLGLIKGNIVKMKDDREKNVKIPHIGWNNLKYNRKDILFKNIDEGKYVYYVHSYFAQSYNNEDLVAYSEYGENKIPGIIRRNNIIGAQFHPEKSGTVGLDILKNFGELIK
ncbi:imidazole glycerol phosphate synthase subunit HisH [Clostridium butyricum]|jgi:glutamine amidotransferase|uniref:Imidazole glycerol phosphate synthase subunit HisH n=1 Tax=Clostridium butyricum TaxID=1492 RepID=A0A2S7F8W9_CLOBU|nr:imidazole glycerol phosphate synthase subunit HisH [Clostridium butyricum]ETI88697.1 MAG: Imidazole glycerol phosphate synthase subunit HisH [Clostridium butyricum DORA_1]KHD16109.1 imidazole glycerol phosphate synthase [Clostridium butyricum]MBS5984819.1 imidazole glycerol phosphate synthase subunit HisH [Clostridium butyricum]MBZ0313442.1 imidazole glycerol phosphate synthase subunit HisH [Clostridium butyricum]MDB2153226.1 imidazole glycerol phosphate synthase subunit HisH [Clostridium b